MLSFLMTKKGRRHQVLMENNNHFNAFFYTENGYDPTVIIGESEHIGGNATSGSGEFLIAEVDESDGPFKIKPIYCRYY